MSMSDKEITYQVVRFFFNSKKYPDQVLRQGLSEDEAKSLCQGKEASSRTCSPSTHVEVWSVIGTDRDRGVDWFVGYRPSQEQPLEFYRSKDSNC